MSCKTCRKAKCACDSALPIPTSFSNDPTICPLNSEKCAEIFDMACICWQGEDIVELDIKKGDRLAEILQKLILATTNPDCATFIDTASCGSAINLTIANLTSTSFELSWDAVAGANYYVVEYKQATALSWNLTPNVVPPTAAVGLYGLTPDTVYELRVNTVCATGTCYSLNIRVKTAIA